MTATHRTLARADRDLTALTVLALLTQGPKHPYDLHRFIVDTRKDFVTGLPRSLYHAVDKLAGAGLIEPAGTEHRPGRPERTLYALTDTGRAELGRRVALLLATPDPDATVAYAALSFISVLDRDQVVLALRARLAALDLRLAQLVAELDRATHVPRILLVEAEFERSRLTAERDWIAALAADTESGDLEWPDDRPSTATMTASGHEPTDGRGGRLPRV